MNLQAWQELMQSGRVNHIRPRKWCGQWQLLAYSRDTLTLIDGIEDSPEAYQACRDAGVSVEDLL